MGTAVALAVGTVASSVISSKSQEKAADKQAQSIKDAQGISNERYNQAVSQALSLFEPAFGDISTSLQQARNDLLSGQASSQDILNQAFSQASNAYQTGQQQAMNAILGTPQAAPAATPEVSKATQGGFRGPAPVQTPVSRDAESLRAVSNQGLPQESQLRAGVSGAPVAQGTRTDESPIQNFTSYGPQQDPLTGVTGELDPLTGQLNPTTIPETQSQAVAPQGQYGLAGAESALRDSAGALTTGAQDALGSIGAGFDQARGDITGQLGAGLGALRSGVATGRGDISSARDAAIGYLDPYESTGQSALKREAALSGALGPEAQAEAFESYNQSPGQQYFRDQQEKSLLRNQAAVGGLGSGNVLTALQEQSQGIASQQYQQDLENLRSLAGRGQQAATTQGGYQTQAGRDLANLAFQGGAAELGARTQAGSALSQLAANRGLTSAQVQQGLGRDLSNVYGQVSGLRNQAGQNIAAQLSAGGQNQANLISQLGGNLANIDQQTAANIANLAAQQGSATSGLRTGLAALLTNAATGQGAQQANLATQLGGAQAAGVTNPIGNSLNQLLGLYASNPSIFGGGSTPSAFPGQGGT